MQMQYWSSYHNWIEFAKCFGIFAEKKMEE